MSLGLVDRYELLQLIGQGSFGGVYRARHIHTGQVHALKLARDTVDPDGTARVLAEARAAASLRHPNVVGVIDGGVAATGEAFIVMELLEGSTLAQVIAREGPLPPARATRIARQMLDGLAAAHANGIVHRDVKPSNVFVTMASDVTGGDMVKVIDFGISKVRQEAGSEGGLTLPGIAMGTPGYMAPEQLGDARSVDGRADVYAVGATLFEMLTKRPPIESDSFETWMRKLMSERAPLLGTVAPHVPPALAAVVDRALARDPDGRWASAGAMRDALDAAFAIPHEGFSPTALDTPRAVAGATFATGATFPSTSSWPAQASEPPPASPWMPMGVGHPTAPIQGHAAPQGLGAPMLHGHYPAQGHPMQGYGAVQGHPSQHAPRSSGGSPVVLWLVGGLVVLIGAVAVIGAGVVFYVTRAASPTPAAAAPAATVTASPPADPPPAAASPPARAVAGGTSPGAAATARQGGATPAPAPVPVPGPPAPGGPAPTPAPGAPGLVAPGKAGSVRISPPRIVGELRQDAFMTLAARARPAIEQCNPDRRVLVVKVDVMIGDKKITIAQPSVNTSPGDPLIARCVAQSLKDAQSAAFAPGASGIYQEAQFTWQ